jgi:hypothetical protein
MKILLSGPIEGYLETFYDKAAEQEPHWVVCAGDYGVWPDPQRMDRAAKKHSATDFSRAYVGALIPKTLPTLLVAGVHDDNRWLQDRIRANNTEVLNNVHWLAQGYRTTIGFEVALNVTGLGRAYSDATYTGNYGKRSHRHYTRHDVERACSAGPTDLLVLYEHLDAPGIRNIAYATRPKLIVTTSHQNRKVYDEIQGIPVVTLGRQETKLVEWKDNGFCL